MTKQKQYQPATTVPMYMHVYLRDCAFYETEDIPDTNIGVYVHVTRDEKPVQMIGRLTHLYSQKLELPLPGFNVPEMRLRALDNEMGKMREEYTRRMNELEEQKQNILSLSGPDAVEPDTDWED